MGSPRTLVHEAIFAVSSDVADISTDTTTNGAAFDRANAANAAHDLVVLVDVGAATDGTYTLHLEDSPDNSVWTDVAAEFVIAGDGASGLSALATDGQIIIGATTGDASQYLFGYMGYEQYVRLSIVSIGTTTGIADVGSWFVGSNPRTVVR